MLYDITVSCRKAPIGLDELPRFSWKLESQKQNVTQISYRITVTGGGVSRWDSGTVMSEQSVFVHYQGDALQPVTAYHVAITVVDSAGETHNGETDFETGLLTQGNWSASWITHTFPAEETACPVFGRVYEVKDLRDEANPVVSVRFFATALGVYELTVNGMKIGDAFLAPGWTSYRNRLEYQTYDITEAFQNATDSLRVELTVGNGWYSGYLNGDGENHFYGDRVAALGMLWVRYADGSHQCYGTGSDWYVRQGEIRSAELYHGETQDYTLPAFEPQKTVLFDPAGKVGKLVSQEGYSVRATKEFAAKELIKSPKGEWIIDFGQNMAGIVRLRLPDATGGETRRITIRHAETLDSSGNFYTENLRTARAEDVYIYNARMNGRKVVPHFTYHGFRYIAVEGITETEAAELERFTALSLHTDMPLTGKFVTNNPKVNRLQQNIEWGQRSNFVDIPTDCPQRDERLGWTGDAAIFCTTAAYQFDTALFYQKWLRDVAAETDDEHGVPHLVPNIVGPSVGTAVWGDCATLIPWQMYVTYGDLDALQENYPLMKQWVEYIRRQAGASVLWLNGFQRGDWLALDAPQSRPELMSGGTDCNLVANVYYAVSIACVRDAAKVLGLTDDYADYDALYNAVREELNAEYLTPHGRLLSETQTACALMLHFDLLKEEYRERVTKALLENLTNHKNHLTTGFVGTASLCHALTERGKHDIAEEVFYKEDYPGWFYAVGKGATTIWERWNSILPDGSFDTSGMNSLNHYSYGAIGDWLYSKVAGITALEPGYKKIGIAPVLTHRMTEVSASLETVYGTVKSEWSCKDGRITVRLHIPANTTAVVSLPEQADEITLGSGCYEYSYSTETELDRKYFTEASTFGEILDDEYGRGILLRYMPEVENSPMLHFIREQTIGAMMAMSPDAGANLKAVLVSLNQGE